MPWAASLSNGCAADLAGLRLFPDIEFAEIGGVCWVRGSRLEETLEQELKKVPGLMRFEVFSSNRLRPVGSRIPDQQLPLGKWRPLKEQLAVALPVAALAGKTNRRIPIVLIRTCDEQTASALRTTLENWVEYATTAPLIRLKHLRFAAADNREVLILGTPLPALSGQRHAFHQGLLVPCGFTWSPSVDASVLREVFNVRPEDYVLLCEDNTHQIIPEEQFVPATRSGARLTFEKSGSD